MAATRTDGRLSTTSPTAARLREARSSRLSALVFSAVLVAASTLLVGALTPDVPVRSAGVFYLLAVLGASSIYGLWWGLATSLASALAFNFFFLPPSTLSSSTRRATGSRSRRLPAARSGRFAPLTT